MYINKAENEYCNSGYKYRGSDKREKKPSAVFLSYRRSAPLKAALFIAYLGILSKLGFFEFS